MTDTPAYGDIKLSRVLGRGLVIDTAPEHVKMSVAVLGAHHLDIRLDRVGYIDIAEQVLYEITGYDPADGTLTLRLTADWRPGQKDAPPAEPEAERPTP